MKPDIFRANDLQSSEPPPLSDYGRRFLAEGDSWFSLGTLNLFAGTNLLKELDMARSTAIVYCSYPGDTLQRITDCIGDKWFDRLLRPPKGRKANMERFWEAIPFSAGGNDLIDAAQHRAVDRTGQPAPLEARILLTRAEAAIVNPGVTGAAHFISEAGWSLLASYLLDNFAIIVSRRDEGINKHRPLLLHTYHEVVVRPAGIVTSPQGWLYPAMVDYGIPVEFWQPLAGELFGRLRTLLLSLDSDQGGPGALPAVHVFDSARLVDLIPAAPESANDSGDWINEIHPNRCGYIKIGKLMGPWIDRILKRYPG